MIARLLALFIIVPLVELALLLYLADRTSWSLTLALVILTGVTGTWLARTQGFRAVRRIQEELAAGRLPGDAVVDAILIFAAGLLLLTPGVLTDVLALTLLIPPLRQLYKRRLRRWFESRFVLRTGGFSSGQSPPGQSTVIDSYVVEDDAKTKGEHDASR